MKKVRLNSKERGITLVALVVTIIIMLVLAGVVLSISISDNGVLKQATEATIEYTHATVKEALEMKNTEHTMARELEETDKSLIEYLKEEKVITEVSEGKYKVEVVNLVGDGITLGLGSNGVDVYMLESTTSLAEIGKVASREVVKLAEENSGDLTYNIVYYDKDGKSRVIGKLIDSIIDTRRTIKFTVNGTQYETKEGTKWYEFSQQNPDEFLYDDEYDMIYYHKNTLGYFAPGDTYLSVVNSNDVIIENGSYGTTWAECVNGNSLILTNLNNETTLAKDIKEGQTIAYYNFETNELEEGTVTKVYIHKNATSFVKYTFEDGSYLEVTDYHPIYTAEGWRSYTRRNGYKVPEVGDKVKTEEGYKTLTKIETYTGNEDCYDFGIVDKDGNRVDNYFANGTLVQSSIN